jgi:RNA polymerase sigma factor (sigma-70 family)
VEQGSLADPLLSDFHALHGNDADTAIRSIASRLQWPIRDALRSAAIGELAAKAIGRGELTQAATVAALARLHLHDGSAGFRTYVQGAIKTEIRSLAKALGYGPKQVRRHAADPQDNNADAHEPTDPRAEDELIAAECRADLARVQTTLTVLEWGVLHDYYMLDMNKASIARSRRLSPTAIAKIHTRALSKARRLLGVAA